MAAVSNSLDSFSFEEYTPYGSNNLNVNLDKH
jgi:hypothetical protein